MGLEHLSISWSGLTGQGQGRHRKCPLIHQPAYLNWILSLELTWLRGPAVSSGVTMVFRTRGPGHSPRIHGAVLEGV